MKKIAILFLSLFISGCIVAFQSINDPGFEKIVRGMSQEEVIGLVGEPSSRGVFTIDGKDYEAWKYPVQAAAKKFNTLGVSHRRILFSDGKVTQWEKIKVYAQPSYEFKKPDASEGKAAK